MPDKFEIASYLRETGLLLSAKGENQFKARAYLRGAMAIEASQADIEKLIREDLLTTIPGIGESLAKTIKEIYKSGESSYLHRLKDEVPEGTIELSQIPGLTLEKIRKLTDALGVRTIAELEQACIDEKVRLVPGFAARSERALLGKIQRMKTRSSTILLVDAFETAEEIVSHMRSSVRGLEIELTGDVRRWHESVEKIQFVAKHKKPSSVLDAFSKFPLVVEISESTESFLAAKLFNGLRIELFMAENLPLKLLETTGHAHFLHLQKLAKRKGFRLDDREFKTKAHRIEVLQEDDVYHKLGLSFIPPELREDEGEIELARKDDFSDLLEYDDIQGMTHCHSTYSDGRHSIEQMARAAERMGMKYITITDHSPTAHYAGGLALDRLKQQWEEIARVQEKVKIKLLKGTECDILADGALDYPDDILEQFDVIIASIHSRYKQDEPRMTKRLLNGLRNPYFKIWGPKVWVFNLLFRLMRTQPPICRICRLGFTRQDEPVFENQMF